MIKAKYALGKYTAFPDLNNIFSEVYADYGGMDPYFSYLDETQVRYPQPTFNVFGGLRIDF